MGEGEKLLSGIYTWVWWRSDVGFGSSNATSQDARHTESRNTHFISTSPARLNIFILLPYSQTLPAKPGLSWAVSWESPAAATQAWVCSLVHWVPKGSLPRALQQETGSIKRTFDGHSSTDLTIPLVCGTVRLPKEGCTLPYVPKWNSWEKSDTYTQPTFQGKSPRQNQGFNSAVWGFLSPSVL